MLPSSTFVLLFLSHAHVTTCNEKIRARADCSSSYTTCNPQGAAATDEPAVGNSLSPMFVDILDSINSPQKQRRSVQQDLAGLAIRATAGSLCCADGTQCSLLKDYNLPFCYDNYTTNYFLPGGAYGQIVSGNYTAPDGSVANLISGNYTLADGTSGNIYGSPSSPSKPDTATLTLPTQYTASGSGSAIPATALGQEVTYTTTIPGTTIQPSIVAAETVTPDIVSGSTITGGTTKPASTIPGTTIAPKTSTAVTRLAATQTTKSGSASHTYPKKHTLFGTISLSSFWMMLVGL